LLIDILLKHYICFKFIYC